MFSQVSAEAVQALLPTAATLHDPALGRAECPWLDCAGTHSSALLAVYETAAFEYLQMLDNRRQ